ncbi:MAG: hypothetical protein O7C98_11825, partial [Planctomycetota bacterium]|nr:hypothetical protein [Planctomycetota bacterium]
MESTPEREGETPLPTPEAPPTETVLETDEGPKKRRASIVSRLFGFGRKNKKKRPPLPEKGFARTEKSLDLEAESGDDMLDEDPESARITVPEQVIRVRTSRVGRKDEAVGAIQDGFRELTSMLSSVNERLERTDGTGSELTERLSDLPDFLRTMPRLQEDQTRALGELADKIAEGTGAAQRAADALTQIPDIVRDSAQAQREALKDQTVAQRELTKVVHINQQKALQLFHKATQENLRAVEQRAKTQQRQMERLMDASVANMHRMFMLAGAFAIAAIVAV